MGGLGIWGGLKIELFSDLRFLLNQIRLSTMFENVSPGGIVQSDGLAPFIIAG